MGVADEPEENPLTTRICAPALPHDPYIDAVVTALTDAGLKPDRWWTSDAETDPDGTGETTMLNAILTWEQGDDHPDGLMLIWEEPADQWQWAEINADGSNTEARFLPYLGRWSAPEVVVNTLRALLAGQPEPEGYSPYWHLAGPIRAAVDAWDATTP